MNRGDRLPMSGSMENDIIIDMSFISNKQKFNFQTEYSIKATVHLNDSEK